MDRQDADDLRELRKDVGEMEHQVAELKPQVAVALAGVSNFRDFQEEERGNWSELKAERKVVADRLWTRMQKIALAAIIVPIAVTLLVWGIRSAYYFIKDVSQAIQQIRELHKGNLDKKNVIPPTTGEVYTVRMNPPQDAALKPHYQ
jgi:hypothetical protein